jgi:glucokinase
MHAVGIDIGGTKIAGALVDESGRIVREARVPTPETYGDDIIDAVVALVSELTEGAEAIGVGVAAAGFIDADQATIAYSPNIGWRNEPLKAKLEAKITLPVILENDANAAGWAEFKFGAGRGTKNMIMLTIGTGVGGAVIADSRLLRGGFGIGGELGHIRIVPDGLLCGCGAHGCIEQYGSGTALLKSARLLADGGTDEGATLRKLRDQAGELSGDQVYEAILQADPGALRLLRELGQWLGETVASLTAVLDPEVVVIGGGVSAAGDLLLDPIRKAYLENLPARGFRPELSVKAAEFVNDAGVIGAADLVRSALEHR